MADDTTNPLAPNAAPPQPYDYQQALYERLDTDPEYAQRIAAAVGPGTDLPKPVSALGSLFDRLKPGPSPEPTAGPSLSPAADLLMGLSEKTATATARGAVKAVNEGLQFGTEAAGMLPPVKAGLALANALPGTPEKFRKWYAAGADMSDLSMNPAAVYSHEIDAVMGPSKGGALGFVENIAQFATGFALAGGVVGGAPAGAGKLATGAFNAGKAALVDMSFFDPHAERLSNLINEHAPAAVKDSFLTYLKAEGDDSRAEGRLKNALEGFLVGAVLDGALRGVKALKAYHQFRSGTLSAEQADTLIREQMAQAKASKGAARDPGDFVTVIPAGKGRFKVVPNASNEAVTQRLAQEAANKPKVPPPTGVEAPELGAPLPARPDPLDHPNLVAQLDNIAAKHEHGALNGKVLRPVEPELPPLEIEVNAGAPKDPTVLTEGEGALRAPQDLAAHKAKEVLEAPKDGAADALKPVRRVFRYGSEPATLKAEEATAGLYFNQDRPHTAYKRVHNRLIAAEDVSKNPLHVGGPEMTSGMAALHKLDPDLFNRLRRMEWEQIIEYVKENYPHVDQMRYGRPHELMEVIGAEVARAKGYDAIVQGKGHEFVALNESALRRYEVDEASVLGDPGGSGTQGEPLEALFHSEAEAQAAAASVNQAVKNEAREALDYTPETYEAWKTVSKDPELLKDPSSAIEVLEASGFNPKYAQQPEEVVAAARAFVDVAGEAVTVARGRVVTNSETLEQAKSLFGSKAGEAVLNFAKGIWGDSASLHVGLTALRVHTWAQLRSAIKLSQMADIDPKNVVAAEQAFKALDSFAKLQAYMTGTASNAGRALQAMQIPVGEAVEKLFEANPEGLVRGAGEDAAQALKGSADEAKAAPPAKPAEEAVNAKPHEAPPDFSVIEGLTKEQAIALLRHASMVDNPESLIKLFSAAKIERAAQKAGDKTLRARLTKMALSYRMEAMLSGPLTQVVNTLNNAMVAALRPVEMGMGGLTEAALGDTKAGLAFAQEGWDTAVGLALHLSESMKMAKLAYKSGKNILDPGMSVVEEAGRSGSARTMQNWAGYVMPSRFLMTTDEFFKHLNYRANTRASVLRYAREQGITDPKRLKEMLDEGLQAAFAPQTGAGILPGPLEYSRVQTFSNELGEGTWGDSLMKLKSKHVLVELAMPFIKTPTNVFRYAWQRAPILNALNKNLREDFLAGGTRRASALGKVEMGMVMYGSAMLLAHGGKLTGAGPSDPELRAQWKQAGYQPYSVKVGNQWVSYRRGDPVTTGLGMVADLQMMMGSLDERRKQNAAAAVIAAITSNVANKTYMQGMVEFTDAISSGRGSAVDHLLSNLAGSFIPNAARQLNPDDTIRETHGIIEELKSRVPGLSTTLEPKRNLFGEKLMLPPGQQRAWNPFTVSKPFKKNSVGVELVNLGKAFNMPEETIERTLDLTDRERYGKDRNGQSPYDRMLQMMGTGEIGGAPLRQKLEQLVASPEWQKLPADDDMGPGGMRFRVAARIVESYQNAARLQLFTEYPTLARDYQMAKGRKYVGMAGGMDAVKQYEAMFGLGQ